MKVGTFLCIHSSAGQQCELCVNDVVAKKDIIQSFVYLDANRDGICACFAPPRYFCIFCRMSLCPSVQRVDKANFVGTCPLDSHFFLADVIRPGARCFTSLRNNTEA